MPEYSAWCAFKISTATPPTPKPAPWHLPAHLKDDPGYIAAVKDKFEYFVSMGFRRPAKESGFATQVWRERMGSFDDHELG